MIPPSDTATNYRGGEGGTSAYVRLSHRIQKERDIGGHDTPYNRVRVVLLWYSSFATGDIVCAIFSNHWHRLRCQSCQKINAIISGLNDYHT